MKLFPRYKIIQRDTYLNNGTVYTYYVVKFRCLLFWYDDIRNIDADRLRFDVKRFNTREDAEKYIEWKLYFKTVETVVKEI